MANGYYLFVAYYKRRWTHLLVSVLPGLTNWASVPWIHFSTKGILSDVLALGCYHFAVTRNSVLANGCYQLAVYLLSCRSKWVQSISGHMQHCTSKCLLSNCCLFITCIHKWCY